MDKMRAAVADIPGMAVSFSQPIQCRIDELVAGTRAQIIVKLFGDDMDVLKRKAERDCRGLVRRPRRHRPRGRAGRGPAVHHDSRSIAPGSPGTA